MAPTTTTKPAATKPKAAGVKKTGAGKRISKKGNTRNAMIAMQAFFKENRSKYKDMDFKEQQKALGADWKKSPQNPKNSAAAAA